MRLWIVFFSTKKSPQPQLSRLLPQLVQLGLGTLALCRVPGVWVLVGSVGRRKVYDLWILWTIEFSMFSGGIPRQITCEAEIDRFFIATCSVSRRSCANSCCRAWSKVDSHRLQPMAWAKIWGLGKTGPPNIWVNHRLHTWGDTQTSLLSFGGPKFCMISPTKIAGVTGQPTMIWKYRGLCVRNFTEYPGGKGMGGCFMWGVLYSMQGVICWCIPVANVRPKMEYTPNGDLNAEHVDGLCFQENQVIGNLRL